MHRARTWLAAAAAAWITLASIASCSAFDEEPLLVSEDAAAPDDVVETSDASSPDGDASGFERRGACPPPAGPVTAVSTLSKMTLYTPPTTDIGFPFEIAPDSTHVTWIEQPQDPDGGLDPYYGNASARVLRAPKTGGAVAVLARAQPGAVTVAVDSDFAYWVTWEANLAKLYRTSVLASCTNESCPSPELVVTFPDYVRVSRLLRFSSNVLVVIGDGGRTFHVDVVGRKATQILVTGFNPGLVLTNAHVFASSETARSDILRSTVSATPVVDPPYLALPLVDGGAAGVRYLATDCSSLWMTRDVPFVGTDLYVHDFARPGSFETVTRVSANVVDLVADSSLAYYAAPGGAFAIDRKRKMPELVHSGNVVRLAVDDDAIYVGEHVGPQTGTIYAILKRTP